MSYFRIFLYRFFKIKNDPLHIEDHVNMQEIPDQYEALKAAFEAGWKAAMENKVE